MRALAWPDAFPHTDLGVRKALGTDKPNEILALAEKWRPWRAYAVLHLWHSLAGTGLKNASGSPDNSLSGSPKATRSRRKHTHFSARPRAPRLTDKKSSGLTNTKS